MSEKQNDKQSQDGGKPADPGKDGKKIEVKVQYVGAEDFSESYPPAEVLHAIKVAALRHFGLDPSAAGRYVLQYNGAVLAENGHLHDLGADSLVLTLALAGEVAKG